MKRNFSQKFTTSGVRYELLIQHAVTGKFLLFWSDGYGDDWHKTLSFRVYDDRQFTQALAKYLYSEQLVLHSYRELVRQTGVAFSFVDKTSGHAATVACLLVVVDIPEDANLDGEYGEPVFVGLDELLSKFSTSPEIDKICYLGAAHLQAEARELRQSL